MKINKKVIVVVQARNDGDWGEGANLQCGDSRFREC